MATIDAVLFDLSGVLYEGNTALAGAVEAIECLSRTGLPIRYITNTTRSTRADILANLTAMGFNIGPSEVFTAPGAVHSYLKEHGLTPCLLIHPDLASEFADFPDSKQTAVVIGDAADTFTYQNLNQAFRLLINGAPLLAMGNNRYFKDDNGLCLDMGPFVRALEFAADTEAIVLGKPAKAFFHAAVQSTGCHPECVVMIGDDVHSDIIGALDADLQAVLVQTGKYRHGDERHLPDGKGHCVADISEAVDFVMHHS